MSLRFRSNLDAIERKFQRWINNFADKKNNIHKPLAKKEVERTRKRIERTKLDPDGVPWQPWALSTEEHRRRKGTLSRGLLYDTGALLNSITFEVTDDNFAVGSGLEYAEYLQDGTINMEAREFLGFNEEIESDVEWAITTIFNK